MSDWADIENRPLSTYLKLFLNLSHSHLERISCQTAVNMDMLVAIIMPELERDGFARESVRPPPVRMSCTLMEQAFSRKKCKRASCDPSWAYLPY